MCDMAVALAHTTIDGHTLFGHNSNRPEGEGQALLRTPGRAFALGETVRATHLELPQVRQTYTVLACRADGQWGYRHGVNQHNVALGLTSIRTRVGNEGPGLTGADLVRLALERAGSARQALDVITDLIGRYGQGAFPGGGPAEDGPDGGHDSAFLIADGCEAYVLEACGPHWAMQAVGAVRAVSDVCHLRQDWDRISHGLADLAIARGWWPGDGSKLDFAGSVGQEGGEPAAGLRRWGRATLLLEQQSGQIHPQFLRHLLGDHVEAPPAENAGLRLTFAGQPRTLNVNPAADEERDAQRAARAGLSLCRHAAGAGAAGTAASLIAALGPAPGLPPLAWWAFGTPCCGLYFPLLLDGELPAALQAEAPGAGCRVWRQMTRLQEEARRDGRRHKALAEELTALQEQLDQHAREFLPEAAALQGREARELERLAGSFMQHNLERFEDLHAALTEEGRQPLHGPHRALAEEEIPAYFI
jgi:dipeptidase